MFGCLESGLIQLKGYFMMRVSKQTIIHISQTTIARWVMSTSDGLTRIGVEKLSESVRAYAYCLLSSQSNARSNIVGK